jgi:hypothetical protein
MRDFSSATLSRLARKGISILGIVALPDMTSSMPWANAQRGYSISDNGTGRILTFAQVMEAAR